MGHKSILHILQYFSFFSYPPTLDEIYIYLTVKTNRKELDKVLQNMVKNREILSDGRYFSLKGTDNFFDLKRHREQISKGKIAKVKGYIRLVSYLPWIKLVGFSGSIAMQNASEEGDVDLFIITAKDRVWTTRFFTIMIAQLLGLRKTTSTHRICLNLFFDRNYVTVPLEKRNEYVAHEVVQMKPVINKKQTYEYFLNMNRWILDFFPNVSFLVIEDHYKIDNTIIVQRYFKWIGDIVEQLFKYIQLKIINKRNTGEHIKGNQLWLIQDDFERKIMKKLKRI
jgi:hypothetical protein